MRLTRYTMYKRIARTFPEKIKGKILSISELGDMTFLVDTKNSEITEAMYPEYDMQKLPFADETYDYVISDQVLEHLENPFAAVNESFRILKKGGTVIHTSCFINYHHPSPKDFWRFSPDAFRFLCKDFSEIIQVDGWGNRLAIFICFLGDRFRAIEIPDKKWSLRNIIARFDEKKYSISTWIIAKK